MSKVFEVYTDDLDNPRKFETLREAMEWVDRNKLDAGISCNGVHIANKNRDACDGQWSLLPEWRNA